MSDPIAYTSEDGAICPACAKERAWDPDGTDETVIEPIYRDAIKPFLPIICIMCWEPIK